MSTPIYNFMTQVLATLNKQNIGDRIVTFYDSLRKNPDVNEIVKSIEGSNKNIYISFPFHLREGVDKDEALSLFRDVKALFFSMIPSEDTVQNLEQVQEVAIEKITNIPQELMLSISTEMAKLVLNQQFMNDVNYIIAQTKEVTSKVIYIPPKEEVTKDLKEVAEKFGDNTILFIVRVTLHNSGQLLFAKAALKRIVITVMEMLQAIIDTVISYKERG